MGEDELAKGLASAGDHKVLALALGEVELVDEAGDHVAVLQVVVVMGTVHVGGDHAGEVAAVLLVVGPVEDIDHPLGVRVAKVGVMRGPVVDHGLVDGIGGLVREDAGGQARDHLGDLGLVGTPQDVVVHLDVVPEEAHGVFHVLEEAPHHGCQVDHVGGLHAVEERLGALVVTEKKRVLISLNGEKTRKEKKRKKGTRSRKNKEEEERERRREVEERREE